MKKLFVKSLMTVGVVGLVGLTSVAMAAEFNWYGSIRAGVTYKDASAKNGWDLGASGNDGNGASYSRIGIKGSTDLGNGQTAGVQLERGVNATLSVRHENVWISGGWGKLTLGQQGNPYRSAANWDQSWTLGGNVRLGSDGGSRFEGIKYSSNLSGPFSFDVMASGNDNTTEPTSEEKTIDRVTVTAHYDFGVATINLGRTKVETSSNTALSANGSAGSLGWYLAYEESKRKVGTDGSTLGAFVSLGLSENDKVYLEYEAGRYKGEAKKQATLLGYSRNIGDGVTFITEYAAVKNNTDTLNLVLAYSF